MAEVTLFFNPNHDHRGRFSTGHGRHAPGNSPPWHPPHDRSDQLKGIQKLLATASDLRKTLTTEERIALEDYTATFQGSHAINSALNGTGKRLRDSHTGKPATTEFQKQGTIQSIHAIEQVFDKTPLNKEAFQTMRGIGAVGKSWGKVGSLEGQVLSSDALSSTTMNPAYAAHAAGITQRLSKDDGHAVLMVMYAPANTVRALPVSDILHGKREGIRPEPGHEVILPPGTRVKVHKDIPNMEAATPGGSVFDRIVHVEVLPEDPNYRQNLSFRDRLSADVSLLMNPNHDARGRFATGPGARGTKVKFKPGVQEIMDQIKADKARLAHLDPIHEHYKKATDMDAAAVEAVVFYEGNFSRCGAMNDILRYGSIREKNVNHMTADAAVVTKHVEALKGQFEKAPKLAKDTAVYRAVRNFPTGVDPKQVEAMWKQRDIAQGRFDMAGISFWDDRIATAMRGSDLTGKVLKDPGFMSTTADERAANGYLKFSSGGEKPAMLKLTAPAGTPVVAVNSLLKKDGGARAELLLGPGTSYRVTSDTIENGTRVITGEILPPASALSNPNHDRLGRFSTGPGGGAADPGESAGLKRSFELGTMKKFDVLGGGLSGAVVMRATTQDDRDVVIKIQKHADTMDAEYLGARVNDAIGGSPVPVARVKPDTIVYPYIDGQTGGDFAQSNDIWSRNGAARKVLADKLPGAREMGLLDHLTTNVDRHDGNWIVKDGRVYPIDNGSSRYDAPRSAFNYLGPFADRVAGPNSHIDPLYTSGELKELRPKIAALAPEFARISRPYWHRNMMARMDALISDRQELEGAQQ